MKFFFAMLGTETNTFSPIPTGMNIWRNTTLRRTKQRAEPTVGRRHKVYAPLFRRAEERGWEMAPGLQAFATPSGITPRSVYESLRDELLTDLSDAQPVDGVLLFLHGAMVADGYHDCEGDILAGVRERVGPEVPIVAELDLHCHLSQTMFRHADALVGYKEYPHIDTYDRLIDAFDIMADTAEGKSRPVMAWFDCRMIGMYHTTREPMRSFVDHMSSLEGRDGIVNVWLGHGFPYGDVADVGTKVVVVADDAAKARSLASRLGHHFFEMRNEVQSYPQTIRAALDDALATTQGPVTIADTGDNTGGGAPGDSTWFLREMMEQGIEDAALGPLYDPVAVTLCQDGGIGARMQLRIGGKLSEESGAPVDARCTVIGVNERVTQTLNSATSQLGPCAAVKILLTGEDTHSAAGIDVVLSSRRVQAGSPEFFSQLNIEPRTKRILVVKSTQHFHAGFAPISTRILYAGDKGALQSDFTTIPYRNVETARYWPFVEDPLQM